MVTEVMEVVKEKKKSAVFVEGKSEPAEAEVMQEICEPVALVMEEKHLQGIMMEFSRRKESVLEWSVTRHLCVEVGTRPESRKRIVPWATRW